MVISPDLARPAFALLGMVSGPIFVYKYRHDWEWGDTWRLIIAAILGIPLGFFLASSVDEDIFMLVLGILLIAYAIYGLIGKHIRQLPRQFGFVFGFFAGFLHSAYNVGGPPLVLYCSSQEWQPARFRGNMQLLFFFMGWVIIASHFFQGHVTLAVWQNLGLMIPAMLLAMWLGFTLDKYIQPSHFRKAVLIFLIVLGLNLISQIF
jgi:hypothetical protein